MVEGCSVAVVGAGMAGLSAARSLKKSGFDVILFEKGRDPGGRMATRREDDLQFDMGAQYFNVWDSTFREEVRKWESQNIVEPWEGRFGIWENGSFSEPVNRTVKFVGVPRMSVITRHLSDDLNIIYDKRIISLERRMDKWDLIDQDRIKHGPFDLIVLTPPAPQTRELVEPVSPKTAALINLKMQPCWSVMAALRSPLEIEFDGLFLNNHPISWAARDSSKPGREGRENWVLHGSGEWSTANFNRPNEEVASMLLKDLFNVISDRVKTTYLKAHKWRYATVPKPLRIGSIFDREIGLGIAGDWLLSSRVEGAFLSGTGLAETMKRALLEKL